MQVLEESRQVYDCSYIGTVKSSASHGGSAQCSHQIRSRHGSQRRNQGWGVSIVQNELVRVLRQAGRLLVRGFVEALLVQFDPQGSGKQDGSIVQRLGIQVGAFFN